MALQPLSIGDILMLSQTAWKIGRAFTQGKKSAPSEFAEVEREANGLSEALKLVAETLHEDGSVLSAADRDTKTAVNTILESARKTLGDLESFVERYQVIKKKETDGGFVVERSWSEAVLANYRIFRWTSEGGDLTQLRNMLQMHTNSLNLTMQALQSKSLARLEKTVVPMAENIADIHEAVHGDLGSKIDDLHRIIMALANSTPSLHARDRAIDTANGIRNGSVSTVSTIGAGDGTETRVIEAPPPRSSSNLPIRQYDRRESAQSSQSSKSTVTAAKGGREDSAYYSMGPMAFEREGRRMDWGFETGSPPDDRADIGMEYPHSMQGTPVIASSSRRESNVARRESTTLPNLFSAIDEADAEAGAYYTDVSPKGRTPPPQSKTNSTGSRNRQSVLPPPALPPDPDGSPQSPATPLSFFGAPKRQRTNTTIVKDPPRPQTARSIRKSKRESVQSINARNLESPAFEKLLFRNAAILCDVRGTLVEYAQTNPEEPDPRFNIEMKEACKDCRVCVIRKRENREHGGTKVVTSIWTLSDDDSVHLQHKLSEINETVPFGSFFDPNKVSLSPSEGFGSEIALRFHSDIWGDVLAEKKTNWINYIFEYENDAVTFQSAVFGRTLIGSYSTTKTSVIHEGLKGAFAFEEQFANIEMLRLWEDDGTSTPGAAGGVMALMHISSNFGEGWARWWINSSKQQVRVKEDGYKWAKVKGIDVTVVKPGTNAGAAVMAQEKIRQPSMVGEGLQRVETALEARPQGGRRIVVKKVTGVKMEFKDEEERAKFVAQCKRVQERMIMLPDL